jgi:hypothetical protein
VRVEAGRAAKIRVTFLDTDGETPVVQVGTPTASAADGAGATLHASLTVTAVSDAGDGVYEVTLPAQTVLDHLRVVVVGSTGTITVPVNVVEQRLVTVPALRAALQAKAPDLQGATPSTPALLSQAADAAEDWFGSALGYPATREGIRETFRFQGGQSLRVPGVLCPGVLRSASVDQVAVTQTMLDATFADGSGWGVWEGGPWAAGVYRVFASHGLADPPEDLRRAGVVLARYLAQTSNVPERAASMTTESTLIVFSKPDPDKPTGLPEVDAVLGRLRLKSPLGTW